VTCAVASERRGRLAGLRIAVVALFALAMLSNPHP